MEKLILLCTYITIVTSNVISATQVTNNKPFGSRIEANDADDEL